MKKIGLICLALVLALGTIGVGYALWSDTLFLEGTVGTGNIGLEWSQDIPYDDEAPDKDVSWATCIIIDDTLYIDIFNAYPSITYTIPIDLHGTGSVPVHTSWTVLPGNANPAWITMPNWGGLQIHQGDSVFGDVVVHLDNTAEQGMLYSFSVILDYWQYNEPGPGP